MTDTWQEQLSAEPNYFPDGVDPDKYDSDLPTPTNPQFALLDQLVTEIEQCETTLAQLEMETSETSAKHRDLTERQLPDLLDEMGLEEVKTLAGLEVKVNTDILASITKENEPAAFQWLNDNGHGNLMKRAVTVAFNKGQEDQANELMRTLSGKFAAVSVATKVHPSTLKSFVRERLGEGKEVPEDIFGVYRRRVAKINRPGD